jgi:anti-sigma-K factor RskA
MNTIDIHALAGAYVLNAVDDVERAAFARHLAACEACAVEVAELTETGARLADLQWENPSPRLRESVLAEIGRTRQTGPAIPRVGGVSPGRWRRWTAAAVAAAVAAVGAAGITYAVQDERVRTQQARADDMQAIVTAPDAQFRMSTVAGGGRVSVVLSPSLNEAMVSLAGLASPPSGQTYQLWVLRGDTQASAGLIGSGAGVKVVSGINGADGVGVTLEPAGGSAKPHLPMVTSVLLA